MALRELTGLESLLAKTSSNGLTPSSRESQERGVLGANASSGLRPLTNTERLLAGVRAPVQAAPAPAPSQPSILGEFGVGARSGLATMGIGFTGTAAAAAELFGLEESAQKLAELVREGERERDERFPRTVQSFADINDVEDAARFLARGLGEQVPLIASIIAGGGVAGLIGKAVGRGVLGAAEGSALLARTQGIAQGTGAVATASGIETGLTVAEQLDSIGRIEPGVAFTAGIAKGSLEAIVPFALGARLGIGPEAARGVVNKMLSNFDKVVPRRLAAAGAAGVGEGVTEALQESIDLAAREYVDENFDALGPEAASRLLNAAGEGALFGAVFGGIFGGGAAPRQQQTEGGIAVVEAGTGDALPEAPVDPQIPLPFPEPDVTPEPTEAPEPGPVPAPTPTPAPAPIPQPAPPQPNPADPVVTPQSIQIADIGPAEIDAITLEADDEVSFVVVNESTLELEQQPVLEPPGRTQVTQALTTQDRGRVFALDPQALNADEVSADVMALPGTIAITDPRVVFDNPDTRDQALAKAKEAAALRSQAFADLIGGFDSAPFAAKVNPRLIEANNLLREAIALGFRYLPQPGDAIIPTRPLTANDLKEIQLNTQQTTSILPPQALDLSVPAIKLPNTNGLNLFPVGFVHKPFIRYLGHTSIFNPGVPKAREERGVRIDPNKLDKESKTASFSNFLHMINPETMKVFPERFPSIVEKNSFKLFLDAAETPGLSRFFFVKGTSQAKKQSVFKELRTLLTFSKSTTLEEAVEREAAETYARILSKGFRMQVLGDNNILIVAKEINPEAVIGEVPLRGLTSIGIADHARDAFEHETRLKDAGFVDMDTGELYDLTAHPEGTVRIVNNPQDKITPQNMRRARKIARLYERMMKVLNLRQGRIVLFIGQGSGKYQLNDADGAMHPGSGGFSVIGLDLEALETRVESNIVSAGMTNAIRKLREVEIFMVAAHEFGHYVAYQHISKAAPGVKDKMVSAYNRALIRANLGSTADARAQFFSGAPGRTFGSKIRPSATIMDGNYFFSFDEWIAEQIARFTIDDTLPALDPVSRMFKRIAASIKRLLRDFWVAAGGNVEDFKVDDSVREWVDTLRKQHAAAPTANKQDSFASVATTENSLQTQFRNVESVASIGVPASAASFGPRNVMDKLGFPKAKSDEIGAQIDHFNWLAKVGFTLRQVAIKNPHINRLQRYVELADLWLNRKMQWISRSDRRVREWKKLSKDQGDRLAKFIFDIDQMNFRTRKEKEEGIERSPTDQELQLLVEKHGLDQQSFDMYLNIRQDLQDFLTEIERISLEDARRTIDSDVLFEIEKAEIQSEFKRLRAKPYFPHSRFGEFALVVKDSKGKTVFMEQFETDKAMKNALAGAKKEFPAEAGFKIRLDRIPKEVQPFRGLPPSLLKSIRTKLQLNDAQKVWLDQLIVESFPSKSFRKRLSKRENTPGFSLDAMRSYANYFFHAANYLSRMEYFDQLQSEINSFNKEISETPGAVIDVRKRRQVAEFLQDHFNKMMNPIPDWAALRSFAFQWWLGFSPASAAINFTQIPLVAWPYLSSRFGDVKAANEIRKAVFSVHRIYLNKENAAENEAEFKSIERGIAQGFLDESQATELAATAEGSNLQRLLPGNKLQRFFMQSAHWSAFLFQASENINRRVVFRAAYRLALNNPEATYLQELKETQEIEFSSLKNDGFSDSEALAFLAGRDAVRRTQFEYAAHARPAFMRGRKGTILTFFMFVQNMVWFAAHSPGRTRFLLMMLFTAGLMGLPGADDLVELTKFAARNLFGAEFDLEKETRELIAEMVDDDSELADLMLHGVSRIGFGLPHAMDMMGIPFPQMDLSGNIGLGQILPGVATLGPPGLTFEERLARFTTDAGGAAFGIGFNLMKALSDDSLPVDDFKRWERAVPRTAKNLMRAYRFAEEGRERKQSGATFVEFDVNDPEQMGEIISQAIGFTPTRLTRKWNRETMQREAAKYWEVRKRMVLNQMDHALEMRDKEALSDMRAAIRRFNSDVPFAAMRITSKTVSQSRKARVRARLRQERGLPETNKNIPLFRDIERLTPEVDPKVEEQDVTSLR